MRHCRRYFIASRTAPEKTKKIKIDFSSTIGIVNGDWRIKYEFAARVRNGEVFVSFEHGGEKDCWERYTSAGEQLLVVKLLTIVHVPTKIFDKKTKLILDLKRNAKNICLDQIERLDNDAIKILNLSFFIQLQKHAQIQYRFGVLMLKLLQSLKVELPRDLVQNVKLIWKICFH